MTCFQIIENFVFKTVLTFFSQQFSKENKVTEIRSKSQKHDFNQRRQVTDSHRVRWTVNASDYFCCCSDLLRRINKTQRILSHSKARDSRLTKKNIWKCSGKKIEKKNDILWWRQPSNQLPSLFEVVIHRHSVLCTSCCFDRRSPKNQPNGQNINIIHED